MPAAPSSGALADALATNSFDGQGSFVGRRHGLCRCERERGLRLPVLLRALAVHGLGAVTLATALPRGVAPGEQALFQETSGGFHCLNGAVVPRDALNDDYCDCADGSDEPGTAACSGWPGRFRRLATAVGESTAVVEGLFYCANAGSQPQYVYNSRVNDGVCDCCDGMDEWFKRLVVCEDTCHEQGREYRQAEEQRLAGLAGGRAKHAELQAAAQGRRSGWLAEAASLRAQLLTLQGTPPAPGGAPEPAADVAGAAPGGAGGERPKVSEYAKWMEGGGAGTEGMASAEESQQMQEVRQRLAELEAKLEPGLASDSFSALAMLVGDCFEHNFSFTYKICIGRESFQDTPAETQLSLGRWDGWDLRGATGPRAVFKGGGLCPGGVQRRLVVSFECSGEATIKSVEEPQTCAYEAVIQHAAACGGSEGMLGSRGERPPRRPRDEL